MAPVTLGSVAALSLPASAGGTGTPTLSVTLPDGTTSSPAVTGTGPWAASLTASQPGRHLLRWSRGGVVTPDVLDVWPADPHYLVAVEEAVTAVASSLPAADRADLPLFLAAASYVVESLTGPLLPAARTAKRDGGRPAVVLPVERVTVQSVTVNGTALAETDYVVDEDAGIVHAVSGWFPGGRPLGVVIEYRVGSATIPANLRLAVLELVAYLWQTGRQGGRVLASDTLLTPSGFAIPRRVAELCAATHAPATGFA